jgi:outer membrane protein assembly factor BamC
MPKGLVVLASVLLLGGCSSMSDWMEGKTDYKNVNTLPPLEVPPDLTSPTRDNRYQIPDSVTAQSSATLSRYEQERKEQKPMMIGGATPVVLPPVDRMHVERAGSQRWLVVEDQAPEKLWPVVRDFWQENGFLIALNVPEAGVMETDWAENRAKIPQDWIRNMLGKLIDQIYSTAERDKFRTRLERNEAGGSEIYISHRGMIEVFQDIQKQQSMWQPRKADPDLEAEFLRRLMVRLGTQEEKAKQQVATSQPAPARAAITAGLGGFETLEVFEPFDRTWRRVGLALDRVGFTVEDRDRQKGQYFVRYADTDASDMARKDGEKGLLAKLQFWKSSDPIKAEQYRVHIRQFAGKCVVQVLNKDGAQANTQTTKRIVALLHEQLR